MSYCAVLCCAVLCGAVLCCAVLCCAVFYVLYCIVLLIAGSESELQALLNTVVDASMHRGLSINIKKTQCMVISKSKITPTCHIHINNETIKQVEKFKYLGSTITSDGRNDAEIKIRIGMARMLSKRWRK